MGPTPDQITTRHAFYTDRTFGLDDLAGALAHVCEGRALGKNRGHRHLSRCEVERLSGPFRVAACGDVEGGEACTLSRSVCRQGVLGISTERLEPRAFGTFSAVNRH
jgi:hypothetical protein